MTFSFCYAVVLLVIGVVLHFCLLHLRRGRGFLPLGYTVLLGVIIGAVPFTLTLGWQVGMVTCLWLIILWNLYLIFFINLMNSVSLRIMIEIARSPHKALTHQEIMDIYSDDETFRARVAGLEAGGFITLQGTTMTLTTKGKRFAQLLALFRAIFGITHFG